MGRRCCVVGCHGSKASMYRFPRDDDESKLWKKAVFGIEMENKEISKNDVVCALHWPENFETVTLFGKIRPKYAPSIFPIRPITKDQMESFLENDTLSFENMKDELFSRKITRFKVPVTAFLINDVLHIQSEKYDC